MELRKFSLECDHDGAAIIIDAHIAYPGDPLIVNAGFDLACELRRNHLGRFPIILASQSPRAAYDNLSSIDKKYDILNAVGTGFLQLPITHGDLLAQFEEISPLSDTELKNVILESCNLRSAWAVTIHIVERLLKQGETENYTISGELERWERTISFLRPELKEDFSNLKNLLSEPSILMARSSFQLALQGFDRLFVEDAQNAEPDAILAVNDLPPSSPPRGFSKVLIADDNPQQYLKTMLRSEYGYDVVEKQATKLREAISLFEQERPDVVLADLYFKRSGRASERANKAVGEEFIRHILANQRKDEYGVDRPMVLVTSKATVRADEILFGAINCSGPHKASDPASVHQCIWAGAREQGITEPAAVNGTNWRPEMEWRSRLDTCKQMVPDLRRQWSEFSTVVQQTHTLSKLLLRTATKTETRLVSELIKLLSDFGAESSFSLKDVQSIFERTGEIHKRAKVPPFTETNNSLRNILHGKIEQFSSVVAAVNAVVRTIAEVSEELITSKKFNSLGTDLQEILAEFSSDGDMLNFLDHLELGLKSTVQHLPKRPDSGLEQGVGHNDTKEFTIVIVEDNDYWAEQVLEAVWLAEGRLGEGVFLNATRFNNAAEALAFVAPVPKTHAILNAGESIPTLAIVDICMPKDRDHAMSIVEAESGKGAKFVSPGSEHGLDLIKAFSGYDRNLPLIVFSTIDDLEDRKKVCAWGIPERSFVSKSSKAPEQIARNIIRFVENSDRYVIRRLFVEEGEDYFNRFWINGLEIKLSPALNRTFTALFELSQIGERNEFSIEEINEARNSTDTDEQDGLVQDHIHKIRKIVFDTFRRNRSYINARHFIKTRKRSENGPTLYQLNAEIVPLVDESWYDDDLDTFSEKNRILLVESNSEVAAEIEFELRNQGYEVIQASDPSEAVRKSKEFEPHLVSIGLANGTFERARWDDLLESSTRRDFGVVFRSGEPLEADALNLMTQMGIPLENLATTETSSWLPAYLGVIENERRRIFLGEATDLGDSVVMPVVKVLNDCDFDTGRLNLNVNGRNYSCRASQLARIIGFLLQNPRELVSYELVKRSIVGNDPVTQDDRRNWPQRIRKIIETSWLDAAVYARVEDTAKRILESSAEGLKLNVHVVDGRKHHQLDHLRESDVD
ncbi:hypothetical protein [Leptolyngbya sp. 7M]|uniref:hypothetical protein n=1 Tax=Leptolyngbya sp. 7M TaxID=2812896 RepID=UPI001B8B44CE|nr:hypothetical protein [Leptolyngbya sp. 7M]QYO65287.1 hypothetical protein JVX88_00435 [Leptolyngbya sp. 7M]